MSAHAVTEQELLLQLDRVRARKDLLVHQRFEAEKLIGEYKKEEERIRRQLHFLERSESAC
jgi:hypothetical protein